jgi:hypothetical protein
MKGDFTRNTFDPFKHFLRVLQQEGRVQVDADFNEQVSILLHYLRTLAADIIGPHGAPMAFPGFGIGRDDKGELLIGMGRYYVDGILCENEHDVPYSQQRDYPGAELPKEDGSYMVYLDVWERHMTFVEDDSIREVALGGPDTSTRTKVVWQVKTLPWGRLDADVGKLREMEVKLDELSRSLKEATGKNKKGISSEMQKAREEFSVAAEEASRATDSQKANHFLKSGLMSHSDARLKARARQDQPPTDACNISPEARYRGAENHLYRVEIHRGTGQKQGGKTDMLPEKLPTFKFSRDNGSNIFPILKTLTDSSAKTTTFKLEHVGRDIKSGLAPGDWVELVDDSYTLLNQAESLLQVSSVDRVEMMITVSGLAQPDVGTEIHQHPFLRRWDHKGGDPKTGGLELTPDGAALIKEGEWLSLEDGIQVWFEKNGVYRTGDYWLIPARTPTGDVEWPHVGREPKAMPPRGVLHHYAPLALVSVDGENMRITPYECIFPPLCYTYNYSYYGAGGHLAIGGHLLWEDWME